MNIGLFGTYLWMQPFTAYYMFRQSHLNVFNRLGEDLFVDICKVGCELFTDLLILINKRLVPVVT